PAPQLNESRLLTPFESTHIPEHYKEYYQAKRNNLFATIQGFPYLWETCMRLDAVWERGIRDLNIPGRPNELLPLQLYLAAHAKVRIVIELAMSCCPGEARSVLRDAVECAAHAHRMCVAPHLQVVWISKEEDEKAFKQAFEHNKKEGLFLGLEELYRAWGTLSETGSHATVASLAGRSSYTPQSDGGAEFLLHYTGGVLNTLIPSIFEMLLTCSTMENTFFRDFEDRLSLDHILVAQRHEFNTFKEAVRRQVISEFKIDPPECPPDCPIV
ncbi:MAG TPA: hypothetical protein PKJ41_01890, partial [Bryobacteraceae bacterium]|nr:hypothetical protein [Bryobacteraceae bacterium]